jgi:hypothetical protein
MPIDKLTSYPSYDESILGWYADAYDLAYIALHPFVRIPGLDPALCNPWTTHINRSDLPADLDLLDIIKSRENTEELNLSPHVVDELTLQRGVALSWNEVGKAVGFTNFADLNRALLTSIGALKTEYQDQTGAELLSRYCSSERIFPPSEGNFQASMQQNLSRVFRDSGVDRVEVAGEFDEEASPLKIDLLHSRQPWCSIDRIPHRAGRIFAADRSLLIVVDWDSFFTLICGKAERLQSIPVAELFEGFWCSPDTRHSWWLQPTDVQHFRH